MLIDSKCRKPIVAITKIVYNSPKMIIFAPIVGILVTSFFKYFPPLVITMKQHEKYKFAFVGHSNELANTVKTGVDPAQETLICKVVKTGEAITVARDLFDQGTEIVFGHMGNSRMMLKALGKPIVDIPRTRLDLIIAFKKAKEFGSIIGLSSFAESTDGIPLIEELLGIRVHQMIFDSIDNLESQVQKAFMDGIKIIVGGGISTRLMEKQGGHGILSLPRKFVIDQAFSHARMLAEINRKDREANERLKAILQMVDEGIIGTDQFGRLTEFNRAAAKILGITEQQLVGNAFSKILSEGKHTKTLTQGQSEKDEVCTINGKKVVVNAKPIRINGQLRGAITLFRGIKRIQDVNRKVKESLYSRGFVAKYKFKNILGQTKSILATIDKATKYAATDGNILIQGETGTGKEMLAQGVHNMSLRKEQAFVGINCGAIPESLIESELFGYEAGAFTGAKRGGKIGLIELADKGTIFLDEIADISRELQVRLLRVIENKEVMRVGGDRYVNVDVRVISSSYKDLRQEIAKDNFRADLYYRLASLKLNLPPLRERLEDILLIIESLIKKNGRKSHGFTNEMLNSLKHYSWPGNVRELVSFVESYYILLGREEPDPLVFSDLMNEIAGYYDRSLFENNNQTGNDTSARRSTLMPSQSNKMFLKQMVEGFEQTVIQKTLEESHFNKTQTAKQLGISVNTLWRKLQNKN